MSVVKEAEGNGAYCDMSHATNLELVGEYSEMQYRAGLIVCIDTLAEFKVYTQRGWSIALQ